MLEEIRGTCVRYGDNQVYITMTFGMVCDSSKALKDLLRDADDKLYSGKNNGRNQIVTEL